MSPWLPCKRKDFIRRLRSLGFDGPFPGTRHQMMTHGGNRLAIPSNREYSIPQLKMMLHEAETILGRRIGDEEWHSL